MLERLRQKHPGSTLGHIMFFEGASAVLSATFSTLFRARSYFADRVPPTGPLIIAANHQSYIDPPFIGVAARSRHCDFIARASLFRFAPFAMWLRAVNCVPLKDDSGDAGAIREALNRLSMGHAVVIFPEGNRTNDGAMHTFKRGVALLVKRAKCPVLPAAVEGCFDAWPRKSPVPRPWTSPIAVAFGQPIAHDDVMAEGPDAALRRLEREIDTLRLDLRHRIRLATSGSFPRRGPGDRPFHQSRAAQAAGVSPSSGEPSPALR